MIHITQSVVNFVRLNYSWEVFFDQVVPSYVKAAYSPKKSWVKSPFEIRDAYFFSKGIQELSELFTVERSFHYKKNYFNHPRFRSSYLLYFLPLQAAKFCSIFQRHPEVFKKILSHESLKIIDLGSGPGTASIAYLFELSRLKLNKIPSIDFFWIDQQKEILEDGKKLFEKLLTLLNIKTTIKLHVSQFVPKINPSLVLIGNTLNELSLPKDLATVRQILTQTKEYGTLIVEPASKKTSQNLSQLRDQFLEDREDKTVFGPCLHTKECPLKSGRDWCHFSIPAEIPGEWFKFFSKALSSERHWLKFSYLWVTKEKSEIKNDPFTRLVVSDPFQNASGKKIVLLCEPQKPFRYYLKRNERYYRGDVVRKVKF